MRVPDANTIWTFREALKKADAIYGLFRRFDEALRSEGFLAMSGQIVDATIVAAPKQRNTIEEKRAIKEGQIPRDWKDKPAKLAQKDRDARWTVKYSKAKPREDGRVPAVDLAIPAPWLRKNRCLDRSGLRPDPQLDDERYAAAHDGARLEDVLDRTNTKKRTSGRTRPTARRRTKRCSRGMGSCRASIARSRRAGQCLSACVSPTRRNPKSAARSSTCLRIRKDRWASSCARSAWRALT